MARKRRKKRRRLKIKNIILFLFVILVFFGGSYLVIMMPIKNIYIRDNEILTDEYIIEESHLDSYPSFLLTSSSKIIANLKKNKYIDKVKIKKKIGNIIEITIDEYKAVASIDNDTKLLLSNGSIVSNTYNVTDVAKLNNEIPIEVRKKFAKKLDEVDKNILRQISQIEYSPVKVDNERFLLYMDDGNLVYITLTKVNKLNKYNKIRDKLVGKIGVIYLDSGDYVEFKDNKAAVKKEEDKKSTNE